ncbi:hypothetical protein V6N12_062841 [Hibiscus sabdariffa]|uniref:Nucleic acid binding NABP domain-containing protein n=1 Tax=Hibiscus sabdariffa TaxID=183260 RepID=A0ABR2FA01_9ROSI
MFDQMHERNATKSDGVSEQKQQLVTSSIESKVFDKLSVITDVDFNDFDDSISGLLEVPRNEGCDILNKGNLNDLQKAYVEAILPEQKQQYVLPFLTKGGVVNHDYNGNSSYGLAKQIVFDELRLLIDNGHVVLEGDEETISGDSLLTIDSCDIRNGEVMVIERDSSASMVEGTYMLKKPECKVDFFDMVKDEFL